MDSTTQQEARGRREQGNQAKTQVRKESSSLGLSKGSVKAYCSSSKERSLHKC